MIRDNELEKEVYEPGHINQVLAEIEQNFPSYFSTFAKQSSESVFKKYIDGYEKEQRAYRDYLSIEALMEYEFDPNAFRRHTRTKCPIIRRCLQSPDEVMKQYQKSFNLISGRQLLDAVRNIAEFGLEYVTDFDDEAHEDAATYSDLGLEPLNEGKYGCTGVIGYGVQSTLLYGRYARNFAHRSQNAVWALYFLSGRKDFGLLDGSEFLMVEPDRGVCEQNYFYPAELFGFYSLSVFLLLKSACEEMQIPFYDLYRYVYLDAFNDHVASIHREHINTYTRSSTYVESQPWFWS
jgi:hypothetical protein